MNGDTNSVVFIGAFPPPIHGAALANAAIVERLRAAGVAVGVIDTARSSLAGSYLARINRLPSIAKGLRQLARQTSSRRATIYLSVNGGAGQAYDALFLTVARARGCRIVLHHHSYAYLTQPSQLTSLLCRIAGPDATHIALCGDMMNRLRSNYPVVKNVRVISNASLIPVQNAPPNKRSLRTLGFLGNISSEKGVFDFLQVMKELSDDETVQGILAGPFTTTDIEQRVRKIVDALPLVTYVGPVDGNTKAEFFQRIDALLFPTRYVNEAEPLTIHEAMSYGIPVIARTRGCIGSMMDAGCGRPIDTESDFVNEAIQQIHTWRKSDAAFCTASAAAARRFAIARSEGTQSLNEAIGAIA